MSLEVYQQIEKIFSNVYAKGNFQGVVTKLVLQTGTATEQEIKQALQKANPQRSVSFFTGHRVFEVLTKHGIIKMQKGESGVYEIPYYAELTTEEIKSLKNKAQRWANKFEESSKQ